MQALAVLDTLLTEMPMRQRNLEVAKKEVVSNISNGFPSFRGLGVVIANQLNEGRTADRNAVYVSNVPALTAADVEHFFKTEIKPVPRITVVVGNKKKLDMQQLSAYGRIVELKASDFVRQ